jgi:hypothetical protein
MSALTWLQWLAPLLLVGLTAVLLVLPFMPAWLEWRHPRDALPLALSPLVAVSGGPQPRPSPFDYAHPVALQLPAGTSFVSLRAPTVWLGTPRLVDTSPEPQRALWRLLHTTSAPVPGAQRWGARGWRFEGDARLPAGCRLQGPLVVRGRLQLGEGCVIDGDVKAHGDIALERRSAVRGALVGERSIHLGPGSSVSGPVLAREHLHLARGVRVGQVSVPSTASARLVSACGGSVVHGQVLAAAAGVVL